MPRRSPRGYLTAGIAGATIGILAHLSQRQDQDSSNTTSGPSNNNSYDIKPNQPRAPSHRYSHYRHPSEEEHRTAEQLSWRHGYTLSVLIAVLTSIGVGFAIGTYEQTKRQADAASLPFVSLKEVIEVRKTQILPDYARYDFIARWINSGGTETNVQFIGAGGDDTKFKYGRGYGEAQWIMPPKGEFSQISFSQMTDQRRNTYIVPAKPFMILGWARYKNKETGRDRQTIFCVILKNLKFIGDRPTDTDITYNIIPCSDPEMNCVDEGCPSGLVWPK